MFGQQLDRVVSKVTWTATDGGIRPGQYQDFSVSLGQLPESGELVFQTLQTYSSGERVNWNEVAVDDAAEPEHPAPTLSIATAATSRPTGGDEAGGIDVAQSQSGAAAASTDDGSDSALSLAMSGAALVVSLLTALLVWRRGRTPQAVDSGSSRELEDART
jgi:uncharacterized protein